MFWLLLTIRPTEQWTPLDIGLSIALGVAVLIALGWALSVATRSYDREP